MLKLNSSNLFTISKEDHTDETTKELDEQGTVEVADSEEVVAEVTPSTDVEDAGDDIAQATPTEEVGADDKADITQTPDTVQEEVTTLLTEGEQAKTVKEDIVQAATAQVEGGDSTATDVNGNGITEEQAAENAETDAIEDEVELEEETEAKDKDIHQEAADAEDSADTELDDALGADGSDSVADEATDDTSSADVDDGGDQGDLGIDADAGGVDEPLPDDETPLDGAEDQVDSETTEVEETTDSTPSTDESGDDVTDVDQEVEDQNEAADVTAEAASSDVDQTEFIEGDTPEQKGEVSASGVLPEEDLADNDGDTIVAEAEPAPQNTEDVSTDNSTTDIDEPASEDDEVPLDGAEPLEVDETDPLVDRNQDTAGEDGSAATVEESTTDQTAEDLDEATDEVAETTEVVEEDSTPVEEETETEVVDGPDTEAGEIEETDEEADLDEGELDVRDVDPETTDEDVEEAMADAAETGEWGDAEAEQADIADMTIEELQKEREALEMYRVTIEHAIATESYNAPYIATVNMMVEPLRRRLNGISDKPISRVSVESYDYRDLDLVYQASLESIRGFISRLSSANRSLVQSVEKWWASGIVDKVTKRTDALDKQIDLTLVKLKDSEYSTKDVKGIRGYLSTSESNLTKAVADDLAVTSDIAVKGIKASEAFQNTLVKALNDIVTANNGTEIDSVLDKVEDLKGTKQDFPSTAFDRGLLGGYKLEWRKAGGGDRSEKIEALGHTGIPVGVKATKKSEGGDFKLTKGDLTNLLKMAKVYTALARKLATTTGDRAVASVSKIRLTRERALPLSAETRVTGDEHGIDSLATAMKLVAKAHVDLYKFTTTHCIEVADACCAVVNKAIK